MIMEAIQDKGVPKIALFETDSDRWILEAIGYIKAFLEAELLDTGVIILA
jgi:hypothetical protein